uniref:Uncharacterized protein n=1 Tax=Anguilla anguilla TaxID=7936 RepID=A0A0E9XWZ8_ANGAN
MADCNNNPVLAVKCMSRLRLPGGCSCGPRFHCVGTGRCCSPCQYTPVHPTRFSLFLQER